MTPCHRSSAPPRGLSWPVVLIMLALVLGAAAFWWQLQEQAREAQVVARIGGEEISRLQVADTLRAQLWRRSEAWDSLAPELQRQRRFEALDSLIESKALRLWVVSQSMPERPDAVEDALQTFIKQFEEPDSWLQRASWQHMGEAQIHAWIESETHQRQAFNAEVDKRVTKVTEADIKAWLQDNQAKLLIPERVWASHLFLSAHDQKKPDRTAEIQEHRRRIAAGEIALSTLAGEVSEDNRSNKQGGNLGWFGRDRVPADFAEQVFAQKPGELGEPFLSSLGWHIVMVQGRRPARVPTFEEIQGEIATFLITSRRTRVAAELMKEILGQAPVEKHLERLDSVEPAP